MQINVQFLLHVHVYIKACWFFPIWFKYLKVSALSSCEESASTVQIVKRCPTDSESWKMAAKNMNCEAIKQNCSQSSNRHHFQYHCVINAWMNVTLEVCAPNRTIFGMIHAQALILYSEISHTPIKKVMENPSTDQPPPPSKKKRNQNN